MPDITVRWAGPADAGENSAYLIERTTDNLTWDVLAAEQAATAPYASPASALAANTDYGATTLALDDAAAFPTAGFAWLDDALVGWDGKNGDELTGLVWHSGYGTYAAGSTLAEAHETYADAGLLINHNAVVYRISHIDADGNASAPAYLWHFWPPLPASSQHCVVIAAVASDLGVVPQQGVTVACQLTSDDQFSLHSRLHLDANANPMTANTRVTNVFGLAFFHCWKTSAREDGAAGYEFVLKPGAGELKATAGVIPDRDWVLLGQILS